MGLILRGGGSGALREHDDFPSRSLAPPTIRCLQLPEQGLASPGASQGRGMVPSLLMHTHVHTHVHARTHLQVGPTKNQVLNTLHPFRVWLPLTKQNKPIAPGLKATRRERPYCRLPWDMAPEAATAGHHPSVHQARPALRILGGPGSTGLSTTPSPRQTRLEAKGNPSAPNPGRPTESLAARLTTRE